MGLQEIRQLHGLVGGALSVLSMTHNAKDADRLSAAAKFPAMVGKVGGY